MKSRSQVRLWDDKGCARSSPSSLTTVCGPEHQGNRRPRSETLRGHAEPSSTDGTCGYLTPLLIPAIHGIHHLSAFLEERELSGESWYDAEDDEEEEEWETEEIVPEDHGEPSAPVAPTHGSPPTELRPRPPRPREQWKPALQGAGPGGPARLPLGIGPSDRK
jgi:hypothetical protein